MQPPDPQRAAVAGRAIVISGATSASGLAAARALVEAGARTIAVGRDPDKLARLAQAVPRVVTERADVTSEDGVTGLVARVHHQHGSVDGVLHLVGGWRGGGGLAAQSEQDFRFLERSLTALRLMSRGFDGDLQRSDSAREAIVSSTLVSSPRAGSANYLAVKAGSEVWARAVGHGFAARAKEQGRPLRAASTIFRVTSLEGLERRLANAFVALWALDAASINGDTIVLTADT